MNYGKIQNILRAFSIPFRQGAKAINVCCPLCVGKSSRVKDDKFRCGIFSNGRFWCFRCKRTGSLYYLLSNIVDISKEEFLRITEDMPISDGLKTTAQIIRDVQENKTTQSLKPKKVELPDSRLITPDLVKQHTNLKTFLSIRNIPVQTCIDYSARFVGAIGRLSGRLVVPVYNDRGVLIAWQGRDVTGRATNKYFSQGNIMDHLYWSASLELPYRIYIVEGIYDCWRMGYNSVATFSHSISRPQRASLLADETVDELVFCWDADSYGLALEAARDLAPIVDKIGVVKLPEGQDPDSLGGNAVRRLKIEWL